MYSKLVFDVDLETFFGDEDFGQRKACLLKFVCKVKFD